jgi:aminoglycoside 3-N-acetyltransferase
MAKRLKEALRPLLCYLPDRFAAQRRQRELAGSRRHVTAADLRADLDRLPLPGRPVVLLHSSLKAIGFVEGGPQAVVQVLVDSVVDGRGGTLLVPTYSIAGTMYATLRQGAAGDVCFDVATTPSNLGAIPEAFRHHPGVLRSVHPTHSFAALGPLAHDLVDGHHTCGSSFGTGSPMERLLHHESWMLGLGTTLGNVTLYHCLEDIEPDFPFRVYSEDSPFAVRVRDAAAAVHTMRVSAHNGQVSRTRIDYPQSSAIRGFYTAWLEHHGGLTWHQVGEARSWLVSARRLYEESAKLMRQGITIYTTEAELRQRSPPG